ncbi:MAG: transglycosylase SLT domain-containing protein [Patescibacteria group bacterium]|nr:transglycosylase SLT domain-containing protein [Patescibacteria group bacterium]
MDFQLRRESGVSFLSRRKKPKLGRIAPIIAITTILCLSIWAKTPRIEAEGQKTINTIIVQQQSSRGRFDPKIAEEYLIAEGLREGLSPEQINLMYRIAQAESSWQPDKVSPTGDFGYFQINETSWHLLGVKLGYNFRESWKDNIRMAIYIFKIYGSSPWNASKKGWG